MRASMRAPGTDTGSTEWTGIVTRAHPRPSTPRPVRTAPDRRVPGAPMPDAPPLIPDAVWMLAACVGAAGGFLYLTGLAFQRITVVALADLRMLAGRVKEKRKRDRERAARTKAMAKESALAYLKGRKPESIARDVKTTVEAAPR